VRVFTSPGADKPRDQADIQPEVSPELGCRTVVIFKKAGLDSEREEKSEMRTGDISIWSISKN
jgi:hypothetical protein